MGRLVESLRLECELCKMKNLPNTIRGYYSDGQLAIIHECSMCGYIRHHNKIGLVEYLKRRDQKKNREKVRQFPARYGRLTAKLEAAAKGYRL